MRSASSRDGMFQDLQTLDGALASVRAAILATHPELLEPRVGDSHAAGAPPVRLSAAAWIGDEVLAHIAGLATALTRYSMALEVERVFCDPPPGSTRAEAPPRCRPREKAA
jgi:hypothetical protein